MGDSVSEGTVGGEILKKAGDSVLADEIIAQIETDKVVIDIKSPVTGSIDSMSVKMGDTVVPGTIVAAISEGQGGSPTAAAPASPSPPAAASTAAAPAADAGHGRTPSIKFPPRRLPDGTRISDLPADRQTCSASVKPSVSTQAPVAPAPAAPAPAATSNKGKVYLDRMPSKRPLTKSEMDMINGGGC